MKAMNPREYAHIRQQHQQHQQRHDGGQQIPDELKSAMQQVNEWGEDFKEGVNIMQQMKTKHEKDIGALRSEMLEIAQIVARPGSIDLDTTASDASLFASDIANQLTEAAGFGQLAQSGRGSVPVQVTGRSVMNAIGNGGKVGAGSGSIASNPDRAGIFGEVVAQPGLIQLLPIRPTERDAVEFVRLGRTGDVDVQAKEGDAKAELEINGTLVRAEIVTIAGHTTASRQVLGDHAQLGQAIQALLSQRLVRKVEQQILHGSGEDGEVEGLVTLAADFVPSVGATNIAESIGEGIVDMVSSGFAPSLVVVNPTDWFKISTLKESASGAYIMGTPAQPVAPSLWNRAVAQSPLLDAGTALVLDTTHISLLDRQQLQVMASEHHGDNFIKNLVTLLAELRIGLEVRHTGAVRKVSLS